MAKLPLLQNQSSSQTHINNTQNPHSTGVSNLNDAVITDLATSQILQYDGTEQKWKNADGYTLPAATSNTIGGVKPDGTTTTVAADGTISASGGGSGMTIYQQLTQPDSDGLWIKTDNTKETSIVSTYPEEYSNINYKTYGDATGGFDVTGSPSCEISGDIMTFGSVNSSANACKCRRFDSSINSFTYTVPSLISSTATLYSDTYYSSSCSVGTKCYIFGGSSSSSAYYNYIQIYDTETNIRTNATATLTDDINRTSACSVGTKCYIFGGYRGMYNYSYIQIYDTETGIRTNATATLYTVMSGTSACSVGTKCYIFGGGNYIQIYDTETNIRTNATATLYTAMSNTSACSVGTKCYIFGGAYGSTYYNYIQIYDTETDIRTNATATLYTAMSQVSSCSIGSTCYIFGGVYSSTYYNYIQVFLPYLAAYFPVNNIYASCAVNNKCYIFTKYNHVDNIFIYDILTNEQTSQTVDCIEYDIIDISVASVGLNCYIFTAKLVGSVYTMKLYKYNTETYIVTEIQTTLYNIGKCVAVGDKIYIFGGTVNSGNALCQYTSVFDTTNNTCIRLEDINDGDGNIIQLYNVTGAYCDGCVIINSGYTSSSTYLDKILIYNISESKYTASNITVTDTLKNNPVQSVSDILYSIGTNSAIKYDIGKSDDYTIITDDSGIKTQIMPSFNIYISDVYNNNIISRQAAYSVRNGICTKI